MLDQVVCSRHEVFLPCDCSDRSNAVTSPSAPTYCVPVSGNLRYGGDDSARTKERTNEARDEKPTTPTRPTRPLGVEFSMRTQLSTR